MNALVSGDFFDGSPENVLIWTILGILLGIPLFYGSLKTREKRIQFIIASVLALLGVLLLHFVLYRN